MRIYSANRIDLMADRVDGVHELACVLAYVLAAHATFVETVEVGIEGEIYLLVGEVLAAEWQISRLARTHAVVAHVLEHFATIQMQEESGFVFGEVEAAGVGENDSCIVVASGEVIHNHAI